MESIYKEEAQKVLNKYWEKKWFDGAKIRSMTKQTAKELALLEVSNMITELNLILKSLNSESDSDWGYEHKVEDRVSLYTQIINWIKYL